MTFNQLVFQNIRRQPRVFLSYFFSSVFSVTIFFIAAMLYYHPLLQGDTPEGNMQISMITVYMTTKQILGSALLLLAVLAFIFLGTMFRLYLIERKQSFSLYLIIGMTKGNLRKMLVLENSLIGFASLVVGLMNGLILSKLVFLVVQNLLSLDFSLAFYLPLKAIITTALIYLVIFFLISVFTLFFIKSKQTNMNLKLEDPQLIEPNGNQYLTSLGVMLLLFSYLALFSLMKITKWNLSLSFSDDNSNPYVILVSLLIIFIFLTMGVYLFFNQTLVHFSLFLRKWPMMQKKGRVLVLSNLSYRLKYNSLVYALITVCAMLAFVSMTLTMGLSEKIVYGTDQEVSLAYVYEGISLKSEKDQLFHQKNVEFIQKTIEDQGYQTNVTTFRQDIQLLFQSKQYIPRFYDDNMSIKAPIAEGGSWKQLFLIPLKDYNNMANFKGQAELTLKNSNELLFLNGPSWQDQKQYTGVIKYSEGDKERRIPSSFRFVEGNFNLGGDYPNITVISDELFTLIAKGWKEAAFFYPLHVIDFKEWEQSGKLDKKIGSYITRSTKSATLRDDATFINYKSAYMTRQQSREEKGLTLFISAIIGAVFFIFSASTIYFRSYGELNRDQRYHKTLHIVGVPERNRKQIVTIELSILFFLPLGVALLNYLMIMWSLNTIFSFSSIKIEVILLLSFFVSQLLFFLMVRHYYMKEINLFL
ncbi:ABC transporter permease [uncultured Vagococcus sp.]|uniref:ABC transporter permease n=1 Tax=uncultured Vagococcus sp. TaxID=189676 RepID=UPI0028D048E8|nr:ABC transporter permease [uncultured Vagococcus sp.]